MTTSRALPIAAILALALVGPAAADPQAAPPPAEPAAAETKPDTSQPREGLDDSWADRGSGGYRHGKRKATGSSYNYVFIAFSGGIIIIMAGFLVWLVRRKTAER